MSSGCAPGCPRPFVCSPADDGIAHNVQLEPQWTDAWCWAASGQMTMNFLHPSSNVSQCDEARRRFGRTDCCNHPTPSECVQGGWPEYERYGFTADTTSNAALTSDQVKSQLYCAKKPFAFSWAWGDGGGHMMVARGYTIVDGVLHINVNDPWPPGTYQAGSGYTGGGTTDIYTYDRYVGGPGWDHTHWNDYYNITYKGQ